MSVVIRCTSASCRIESGTIPTAAADDLSMECSYKIEGAEHMKIVKQGKWDGVKKLYHRGTRRFPIGLLSRVTDILEKHNLRVGVEIDVQTTPIVEYPRVSPEFALRPYQSEAKNTALALERCMLRVATGGGKTVIAGHIIADAGTTALFLVHTKDLLYQAISMFTAMFGERWVGQIGDGVVNPAPITVATIQTVSRVVGVKYVKDSFDEDAQWTDDTITIDDHNKSRIADTVLSAGLVIMDECHRVAAPTALDVMDSIRGAQYRIGLSASPWRDDGADLALEAAFGHVAVSISASELIEDGFLVPPIIRMLPMTPQYFNKKAKYPAVYGEYVVNNYERNFAGAIAAINMVKRGRKVLILVRQISHGRDVQHMLKDLGYEVPFLSGSDTSEHRNSVLNSMRDGDLDILIATTIADEGLDIKPLSGLVLLGGGKSSVRALQRIGRVLRPYPGKEYAEVVDFEDNAKFLLEHSQRRMRMYASEPLWTLTDV